MIYRKELGEEKYLEEWMIWKKKEFLCDVNRMIIIFSKSSILPNILLFYSSFSTNHPGVNWLGRHSAAAATTFAFASLRFFVEGKQQLQYS